MEEIKPEELGKAEGVEETSGGAKKATKPKKKPAKRRSKATTAKSKRRKPAAKTLAPEPPPPLTIEELKEQGREAKQEIVNAVVEPAVEVVGSLSQTVRDTISGAFAGLLSRKRRR
jgi:hypothetical protein|tara:strand:- start:39 stop:386 length:348 start_codon:yes stop_codon:yes gene_type:complete